MQHSSITEKLSPKERAKLRMFAAANNAADPQGMSDEELLAFKHDSQPSTGGSEAQADGDSQSQGEQESPASPEQERDPNDPAEFSQQPQGGNEPKPEGDSSDPDDDKIRRIAREEDDWRRDNEIGPALTELVNRIESLRSAHGTLQKDVHEVVAKAMADLAEMQTANDGNKPAQNITLTVERPDDVPDITVEHAHPALETLIRAIRAGVNVLLVGPAGGGKTTLAHTIADALGLEFYFTGAVAMEYKLSGFIDANGVFQDTQFRQAFEKGGLFLFDEVDASSANALLAFNAALANGWADFPDGQVKRHPDFVCIAAANTYGSGADRQYVGRNQLDAASLDRFAVVDMDYDEGNEHNWARAALGLEPTEPKPTPNAVTFEPCTDRELTSDHVDEWVRAIQRWRNSARQKSVRHVISPRASIHGVKLLAAGIPVATVERMVVWKGLDTATVDKIKAA